jgi:hypothetical protein
MLNEQPESPKPISTPAPTSRTAGEVECAIRARPAAYMRAPTQSTRMVPKRSAIAPANGWPSPHSRFCKASASASTSRPQPLARDSGVRKRPSEDRGPKVRMAMRQPKTMMTAGVRQPMRAAEVAIEVIGFSAEVHRLDPSGLTLAERVS